MYENPILKNVLISVNNSLLSRILLVYNIIYEIVSKGIGYPSFCVAVVSDSLL